jgi:hypothetical protein
LGAWDDSALTTDIRCQIVERQQHRERIDTAADILAEMERALRLDCREQIQLVEHHFDALSTATTWTERDWLVAAGGYDLLQRALAAYTLLAFGTMADRARYILEPKRRGEIEAGTRLAGGVRTENGSWLEVLE